MTALGLLERVKGWLGHSGGNSHSPAARPWAEAAESAGDDTLPSAGAAIAAVAAASAQRESPDEAAAPATAAGTNVTTLDPLDPEWMQSLEDLPRRIAESTAGNAAGMRSLEQIAGELEGHRQATRTIAASIRRMPDLALAQGELVRETNKILERQSLVLESLLDGITDLRSAFKTTEESSRRHLKAIGVLETSHRQILFEYQTMFLRSHRRLGYMAAAAAMLAAGALGGVAYVAWYVFATS